MSTIDPAFSTIDKSNNNSVVVDKRLKIKSKR